jgi:hypothetical protein
MFQCRSRKLLGLMNFALLLLLLLLLARTVLQ